jgi:hypothetical protein
MNLVRIVAAGEFTGQEVGPVDGRNIGKPDAGREDFWGATPKSGVARLASFFRS